jgi:hypothetical protein
MKGFTKRELANSVCSLIRKQSKNGRVLNKIISQKYFKTIYFNES